jgi:hypothetical protein
MFFWRDKGYRSRPEYFFCGHLKNKGGFLRPVYALPIYAKSVFLRNINGPDILIQPNPGILRTIAQFVMDRFVNQVLTKSSHFPAKKMMVWYDSRPENRVATKIFIN